MGTDVENVVRQQLSEEAESREVLHRGQFGNHMGWGAIDAVAIFVSRAPAGWMNGDIPGVLLMDVMVAFQRVQTERLVSEMTANHMNGDLILQTESFVSGKMVETSIMVNTIMNHAVQAGVPQVSPVFLILCVIRTTGLIQWGEV